MRVAIKPTNETMEQTKARMLAEMEAESYRLNRMKNANINPYLSYNQGYNFGVRR